jgi:hypothetical protein
MGMAGQEVLVAAGVEDHHRIETLPRDAAD